MTKIVFYASQAKPKNRTNQNHKTHTSPQTHKSQTVTSTPKSTNPHKDIITHKPPKTKQKTTHKNPQKPTKNTKTATNPPKSQTPYPLSQIFANPLFVACQHLSRKIPRFPNHTPCQSSSLLAVCFDLPLCQRHT